MELTSTAIFLVLIFFISDIAKGIHTLFSSRIVNGSDAADGEFPYAVSFRYDDLHECGGSIVADKWVVTAAHCVHQEFLYEANILYGTIESENGESVIGLTKNIKRAIVHEGYYANGSYTNDIALLELDEPLLFDSFVAPVKLPEQDQPVPRLEDTILIGWGYSETDGTVMPILQKVDITIFPDYICDSYFRVNYSTCSHICAGVPAGGKGQCSGDSGGPLTVDGVLHGIVSWSDKPCTITPGILTRVSSFVDWIREIMEDS